MRFSFVVLLFAITATLPAQSLTLDSAISIARVRSPLRDVAAARRLTAEGRARMDGAFPNPTFEVRQENIGSALQPDVFATLQLPIDVTGRRLAQRSAVRYGVARGQADSALTLQQLDYDVARAYWRAALASELLHLVRTDRENRSRLAAFDSGRFQLGAVAEVVLIRARLEVNRARIAEAAAVQESERARAELARAMGLAVDSLPALSPLPLTAALPTETPPEVTAATAQAMSSRLELSVLRNAQEEANRRRLAEQRGIISDLQFVSGYKKTSGVHSGVVGLALPLPVLSRNEGASMRARGEQLLASAELREAEYRVRGEVHAAVQSYRAVLGAQSAGATELEREAEDIAQVAEGAYREGAMSLIELVEAQRTRSDARVHALRWRVDLILAQLEMKRAMGQPLGVHQ